MKIETLKKNHLKRNIIIGIVVVLIISAVILNFTSAKYRVTQSIPLVNGTINYTLPDLNVVAITVDGESVDTIPDGNYELTEESYCTYKDGSTISNLTLNYDSTTKAFSITPYTTKGTKCYLYFTEKNLADEMLAKLNLTVNEETPDFSKTSCSSGCGEATNGLYKEETSKGTTYYFRGTVDNNWVKFADKYWRIIRINEDGSLRLIYSGDGSAQTTGTGTQIGTSAFNSSYNNNAYVGFKYTTNNVHGTGTNSTILTALNTWYTNNLTSYADKIDGNTGFCGDRTPSTSSSSINNSGGTGTTTTYYAGYIRLDTNKQPTFDCSNSSDLYTTSGSSQGNKALQYPIGLITADEVAFAGGVYGRTNQNYYLYTDWVYWTMSPYRFDVGWGGAYVFIVWSSGFLNNIRVNDAYGVRPVINLRSDVTISGGDGTVNNPYTIS